MPTYAYECQGCGHGFEKFQSMSANSLRKCPECGERRLQRLIGPGAGVIFKGSGFYETDYRSESYKLGASADQENSSTSDSPKKNDTAGKDTAGKNTSGKDTSGKDTAKSQPAKSQEGPDSGAKDSAKPTGKEN